MTDGRVAARKEVLLWNWHCRVLGRHRGGCDTSGSIRFVEHMWGVKCSQQRPATPIKVPSQARHVHDNGCVDACAMLRW